MKKALTLVFAAALLISCKDSGKEVAPDAPHETEKDTLVADSASVASMPGTNRKWLAVNDAPTQRDRVIAEIELQDDYVSFGDKITPAKALSQEQMLKKYKALKKGDTLNVKFKSRINAVCKKKGCWMTMDLKGDERAFVKFRDYAFFVPLNADNSEAIISGKAFIDVESVAELKHYAKDGGKSQAEIDKITKPKVTYAFMADGVLIKK